MSLVALLIGLLSLPSSASGQQEALRRQAKRSPSGMRPSKQPALYTLADFTMPGGSGHALDVNKNRTVVGHAFPCAARWERGSEQWVEAILTGPCSEWNQFTFAEAVNDSGSIVGGNWRSLFPQGMVPVIWQDHSWEDFYLPWGSFLDFNSSDQAVGHLEEGFPWGFIWEEGEVSYIGQWVRAWGINDAGQVVGGLLSVTYDVQPAVWERKDGEWELVRFLPTLPDNPWSTAKAVNEVGQIVGIASPAPGPPFSALLWEGDSVIELGTLGGDESIANGINNLGQVVGQSKTADGVWHAFLWQDGEMCDLNDLIITETDLVLETAEAINDLGDVVGRGRTPEGHPHAYFASLLQPGDVNYDTFVGAHDLALLLASWGPCPDKGNCPADFDGDGRVGPFDLVTLLGNWG